MTAIRIALAAAAFAFVSAASAQTPSPAPAAPPAATPPAATTPDTATPPPVKKKKSKHAKAVAAEAAPAQPAEAPTAPATTKGGGSAVFPTAIAAKYASQKPGEARMHTCVDQYHANKASNGNGGLKWIQKGGGYYSECSKKLKAAPAS